MLGGAYNLRQKEIKAGKKKSELMGIWPVMMIFCPYLNTAMLALGLVAFIVLKLGFGDGPIG